jgi:4-alpha-glucanotransferase
LPGASGGGALDGSIDALLDFCTYHHLTVWQVLPLGPTGFGDSPYQSFSTHAGNPYLISLEELEKDDLATAAEVSDAAIAGPADKVDYCNLYELRRPVLYRVAAAFAQRATAEQKKAYKAFCKSQAHWLEDYALYMAIKEEQQKSWQDWPKPLRTRQPEALAEASKKHRAEIETHRVVQWLFSAQWARVREKARKAGVQILGDIPIFVALDSADAWANPDLFQFDKERRPTAVAGVPPDYFSEDGQLWGNPLYRWEKHEKQGFAWWKERMASALRLYDMVRIDHFRGFAGYWSVPAGAPNARGGAWKKAPGEKLFKVLKKEFRELPVVAEDLGDITPDVHALRDKFQLPGMKVLQFAFSAPGNEFLPHHYQSNFVVYTGTHDNNTTAGWYGDPKFQSEQRFFRHYLGLCPDTPAEEAVRQMIRLAMRSVAGLAVVPFQDVLALDGGARMNTPSVAADNWQWRLTAEQLHTRQNWLKESVWMTARA